MSRKNYVLLSLAFLCLISITLIYIFEHRPKTKDVSNEKILEQNIDEKLHNIVTPKDSRIMLSSNPRDYIRSVEGSEDYHYIVSQGDKALKYLLLRIEKSNKSGLEEYIMAMACSEILKENPGEQKWATGKEWYKSYLEKTGKKK